MDERTCATTTTTAVARAKNVQDEKDKLSFGKEMARQFKFRNSVARIKNKIVQFSDTDAQQYSPDVL
jgi:hypothetical protein